MILTRLGIVIIVLTLITLPQALYTISGVGIFAGIILFGAILIYWGMFKSD